MTPNKYASLEDILPFWHLENDGFMVYQDGSLGCGFRLEGADISCAENERINELAGKLENLLASTGEGARLQFVYHLSSSVGDLIDGHMGISRDAPGKYAPLRSSRPKCYRRRVESGGLFSTEIYCFVRDKSHELSKRKFWESPGRFERISKGEFEQHKSKFVRLKKQVQSSLEYTGLRPQVLTSKQWFALVFRFLNLERSEKFKAPVLDESKDFSSQLTLTDLHIHKDYLKIGKFFLRTLTLKNLPEGITCAAMVEDFLKSIPFHFTVTQNVEILGQKRETDKLQLQRRVANSMARGAKNLSDLESESTLHHTEELLAELMEGSEKIVSMDFNVTIWAESQEELEEKSDEVLRSFQSMGRSEGIVETYPLLDAYLASTPGVCQGFRIKKVKSSNCAHLMPVYSPWKGNARPVCLFENRDGGLVKYDPFAPELPAWNALVFAASGSGKSFSILQIAMQFYGQNPTPRIVWIDNGASSERLLDKSILDGQFIDLNLDSKICLNPFDLSKGETTPAPSKVKLILAILEQILKEDNAKGLPKRHRAMIEEAIDLTYRQNPRPTLSDLKTILENHESQEMRSYAQTLYPWTGDRAYGKLLDGKTNIDLTKGLITIEIKGLDATPDLQNVMLLNFTEFIKSQAANDSNRPTLLIIDEAWKLLETPSGQAFTIEAYRTFRKYGSGIWCISQNYKDFLATEDIANALFPNTTSIFILKQTKIDWEDFKKRLQLNEAEVETIKTLRSIKGEYAEAFLMQNEHRSVLRIQADPLAYWIATTDPADKARIARAEEERPGASKLEILQKIAEGAS